VKRERERERERELGKEKARTDCRSWNLKWEGTPRNLLSKNIQKKKMRM
jgi:hypothetical protein